MRRALFSAVFAVLHLPIVGLAEDEVPECPDLGGKKRVYEFVQGKDNREPVYSSKEAPFSYVGKLLMADGGHCTGSLVGEDLVLTNSHCVWKNGKIRADMVFAPGMRGKLARMRSLVNWVWSGWPNGKDTDGEDWAVLRLSSPLGKNFGNFGVKHVRLAELSSKGWQEKLALAGYSADRFSEIPGVHTGCSATGKEAAASFLHDCDSDKGASGSPIFTKFKEGFYLVGLHWGGDNRGNVATYSEQYLPTLLKHLKDDDGKPEKTIAAQVCNDSRSPTIDLAVGYYDKPKWYTEGFFSIPKGTCTEIRVPATGDEADLYLNGKSGTSSWSGNKNWCISNGAFKHEIGTPCTSGITAGFFRRSIERGQLNKIPLT